MRNMVERNPTWSPIPLFFPIATPPSCHLFISPQLSSWPDPPPQSAGQQVAVGSKWFIHTFFFFASLLQLPVPTYWWRWGWNMLSLHQTDSRKILGAEGFQNALAASVHPPIWHPTDWGWLASDAGVMFPCCCLLLTALLRCHHLVFLSVFFRVKVYIVLTTISWNLDWFSLKLWGTSTDYMPPVLAVLFYKYMFKKIPPLQMQGFFWVCRTPPHKY